MNKFDVIVIGGGPAGMMCAGTLSETGKSVLLIEKNKMLGKKLRITGKGRCNITNIAEDSEFFENIATNSKFLYSAYYSFNNYYVIDFFESHGLNLKIERGGRVFPKSDKALDVVNVLINYNKNVKTENTTVKHIFVKNNKIAGVKTQNGEFFSDNVVIATGGKSYPLTGSTGDGYRFAAECGHSIVEPKASLVPLIVAEKWCGKLQGLSLKNVKINLLNNNKTVFSDFGEMLFTHYGLSGPIILSASSHIRKLGNYSLIIDLKPALSFEMLDKRIQRDFVKYSNKNFINALDDLLPKKLIPVIAELSKIPFDKKVNSITKQERDNLVFLLKNMKFTISGLRPIDEAIITSGGVDVKEINPSTMESNIIKGLYFCGEIIDVDAYTGGYNLQIAFSTGHLAAEAIGEK